MARENSDKQYLNKEEIDIQDSTKLLTGRIVKLLGGFYYVMSGEQIYECRARGLFRKNDVKPVVGDVVDFRRGDLEESKGGYIIHVHERMNLLTRPEVSNIDQIIIVFAMKNPNPNLYLLDTLLIHANIHCVEPILCFNKVDLVSQEQKSKILEIYGRLGIKIFFTSQIQGIGMDEVRACLNGKISAFAGPSGVGKSSIISEVLGIELKRGEISSKIKRGKHTTRHCELIPLSSKDEFVCDTPGFSTPQNLYLEFRQIRDYISEFKSFNGLCKFADCMHIDEPNCLVKASIDEVISESRYQSYKLMVDNSKKMSKELL